MKTVLKVSAFLVLVQVPPLAAERLLYRYVDDNGSTVIAYQVPPDRVAYGYEVLGEDGRVIDVVPRQLTEEERADQAARIAAQRAADREAERLREWDESLLLRFSSIEDIEAARDREIGNLQVRIVGLKSRLRTLRDQVENYQAQLADQERRGVAPDDATRRAVAALQEEIAATEVSIGDKRVEVARVRDDYARDLERFRTLLDTVALRRGEKPKE